MQCVMMCWGLEKSLNIPLASTAKRKLYIVPVASRGASGGASGGHPAIDDQNNTQNKIVFSGLFATIKRPTTTIPQCLPYPVLNLSPNNPMDCRSWCSPIRPVGSNARRSLAS